MKAALVLVVGLVVLTLVELSHEGEEPDYDVLVDALSAFEAPAGSPDSPPEVSACSADASSRAAVERHFVTTAAEAEELVERYASDAEALGWSPLALGPPELHNFAKGDLGLQITVEATVEADTADDAREVVLYAFDAAQPC